MKDTKEIIDRLERLKRQTDMAIEMVRRGPNFAVAQHLWDYRSSDTPRTFQVGDFIVTDRHWTKCGPFGCAPDATKPQD
jgi:hypothetical protein